MRGEFSHIGGRQPLHQSVFDAVCLGQSQAFPVAVDGLGPVAVNVLNTAETFGNFWELNRRKDIAQTLFIGYLIRRACGVAGQANRQRRVETRTSR